MLSKPLSAPGMAFPETAQLVYFARRALDGRKRKLIRAVMNPPHYPSTRSQGLAPPPFVEESPHEVYGAPILTPGRLAPTWLEDFVTGKLHTGSGRVGCTAAGVPADGGDRKRHILLIKGHQSFQEGSSEPYKKADGRLCDEVYACVCESCRHHFTFYIWRSLPDKVSDADRKMCGLTRENQDDPFHHLLPIETETEPPSNVDLKLYPFLGSSTFVCSALKCPFRIAIEISGPRLADEYLTVLQNKEPILERRRAALEAEPQRFADVANIAPDALNFLRYYMRDIVEAKPDKDGRPLNADKKIDQRNKKFCIQFGNGPEAHKLFTFLGFEEVIEESKRSWRVPSPDITRPTRPGSQLAFYQDIRSEIETIIGRESQNLRPNAAISFITSALDFGDYPQSPFPRKKEYAVEDYDALGLLPNMHETIFWWAFRCQTQTCPQEELRFFESVERLAAGRDCDDLIARIQSVADQIATGNLQTYTGDQDDYELEIAKQMSLSTDPQQSSAANNAQPEYAFFGLHEGQRSDKDVADKFTECIRNYPSQKSGYRVKLLKIARFRNNNMLRELATKDFSLDEALEYLLVNRNTESGYIMGTTQAHVNANELDAELASEALRVVGNSKPPNERGFFHQLAKSLGQEADQLGTRPSDIADSLPVELSRPVGLANIRNTCYLNSILQYLFTVKPIRKIVLEYDDYALPNTEESLANRRIEPGQNTLHKMEAYAGRQFVTQLSALFHGLQSSQHWYITPPQRLALAALKNAAQLEADGRKISRALPFSQEAPSAAPPVPPRSPAAIANPPSSPNLPSVQHREVLDVSDSISIKSSDTLVDLTEDDDNDASMAKATTVEVPPGYDSVDGLAEHTGHIEHVEHKASPVAAEANNTVGALPAPTADEPMATAEEFIELGLNDRSVMGTDQQDVEEVIGNILSHLRAAVKATGEDPDTNMQTDPVTDTFYWTSATYTRKTGSQTYSRVTAPGRVMTAYPNENKVISLLQALDGSFKREFITDNGLEQFTSIVKLPPILHIHIQRTTSTGGKNETAIEIPLVLHLDRFMDHAEDSDLFKRRLRSWNLQERLSALTHNRLPNTSTSYEDMMRSAKYSHNVIQEYLRESQAGEAGGKGGSPSDPMDIDPPQPRATGAAECIAEASDDEGGFVVIDSELEDWLAEEDIEVTAPSATEGNAVAASLKSEMFQWSDLPATSEFFENAYQMTTEEMQQAVAHEGISEEAEQPTIDAAKAIAETKEELNTIFKDLHTPENEYVLHAVVCHGGNTGHTGHYWVWIFDFERRIWRRYNDSMVTEEADKSKVLEQLMSGQPYYLAYIRASEVDSLVNVQLREEVTLPSHDNEVQMPPPPPPRPAKPAGEDLPMFPPPPTPPSPPAYDEANAEYYNDQLRTYATAPPVDAHGKGPDQGAGEEKEKEREDASDVEMACAQ